MSARILLCLLCYIPRMQRKNEETWFWVCQNYTVCTVITTMIPPMAQNLDDRGRNHGSQQVRTARLTSEEEKRSSSQNVEEQSAQNKVIETAFRPEQAMEKMDLTTKLLEVKLQPAGQ